MSKQVNVLDAVNNLFGGLELSQKKGLYSFEESAKLYESMVIVKQYFSQVQEAQQKAQETQQSIQQKSSKLYSIPEEIVEEI